MTIQISEGLQRIQAKMDANMELTALEMAILNCKDTFISTANGAAQELEELLTLADVAEEHRDRYNNSGTEYWNGRRDEAGFFRDKLKAILVLEVAKK